MRTWPIVLTLALAVPAVAHAQAKIVPSDAPKGAEKTDIDGWNPFLGVTSTLSMVDNSGVVGQVDGLSTLFGLGILGGVDYVEGKHLLRSTLTVNESFARTPVVDQFVKSSDAVKLEGMYNYFATEHLGMYARLALSTALLPTRDVRGQLTTWVDTTTDGMPVTLKTDGLDYKLASAGKPFTVDESLGGFADPVRKEAFSLSLRLGIGGRSTFADGVLVNHDDKATPEVELVRLSDVHQLGVEAFAGAVGKLDKGKANYKAGLAILLPFVNNDKDDRSATELTRIALEGNITYSFRSWLSAVYSLSITRDPQLFPKDKDEVQVQNTLLLTFSFTLVKKKEKDKEKTKEELELEDAKRRAAEAEQRALDAETKLKALRPPAPEPAPAEPEPPAPDH